MRIADFYTQDRPIISMEFFPYRDDNTRESFNTTVDELIGSAPDYMTVTFGAGGSTRDGSVQTVRSIIEKSIPCVGYIAGYGLSPDEIRTVLDQYREAGLQTVFVIRGDRPRQDDFVPHPDSFSYAADLIAFIKKHYNFTIGCAGYPEGHVEAKNLKTDIQFLKKKVDNGAEYIVAQYFYDNQYFFDFVDKCRGQGIDVPIIPGIMPVYTVKMTRALSKICGTTITDPLEKKLADVNADDKSAVLELGIDFACQQCRGLLKENVGGLHFYTMNRSRSTREIIHRLKQAKAI